MSVIFLLGAIQALFFVALMLSKKERHKSDSLLIVWLLAMGIQLISYYLIERKLYDPSLAEIIILLLPPLIYVHGPLLFLYTNSLVYKTTSFKINSLLHFIPFIASFLYYQYLNIFEANGDSSYFTSGSVKFEYLSLGFYLLNIFLNPVYVVIVLLKITRHQRKIKMNFSYLENINLNWLKVLAIGLGSISLIVWIVHIISILGTIENNINRDFWIFLSVTVFVFMAGYFGFKQGVIYKFVTHEESPEEREAGTGKQQNPETGGKLVVSNSKYEKSQLGEKEADEIIDKLNRFMSENRAFINSELSLEDVALGIHINSHTLSQILNVFIKKNFFVYVNAYRVNRVKEMLVDAAFNNYSLLGIAEEAGFNSKSSFNRIFKNETGMTPTEYKSCHAGN